jgi:thiamine phosphate synthase YjbQ (UPF0047 family)
MIDITADVEKILSANEGWDGICVVFTRHTTCGVTVNENADPDVQSDMLGFLRRLIPKDPIIASSDHPADAASAPLLKPGGELDLATPPTTGGEPFFKHAEGNSDAHIKSSLVGCSVTVQFENGKLLLGRWQGIYLCEFDGPRERKVIVSVMADARR